MKRKQFTIQQIAKLFKELDDQTSCYFSYCKEAGHHHMEHDGKVPAFPPDLYEYLDQKRKRKVRELQK